LRIWTSTSADTSRPTADGGDLEPHLGMLGSESLERGDVIADQVEPQRPQVSSFVGIA
jgi:hypothetical protein